ncbi:helix-turn-helix transcriptional regulator [Spirosoma montaniterrae]|uniref:HTH araC/xylS-type domain-containing protein n=1 Tax=Spirosoma montaniterrae TaxID=1178516 RepID=A0A1P9WVK2_9BACT|nr:AraC family transcriptional regulator [Spirosoma montaniterrae]AQG79358.1 hypothetical protein AWR27_08520 [Spirosoma montaniterrae]
MIIKGDELSDILERTFSGCERATREHSRCTDAFRMQSHKQYDQMLSIVNLKGGFERPLSVVDVRDVDHVSLHFQLRGQSDAHIRGIRGNQLMKTGQMNLFACFDPVATIDFPEQSDYEYISVNLNPGVAVQLLVDCGMPTVAEKVVQREATMASPAPLRYRAEQLQILQQLMTNPFPDDLQPVFQRAKLTELLLWYRWQHEPPNGRAMPVTVSATDEDKLRAVKAYLDSHFLDEIAVPTLAKQFLLNNFKLRTGFRALFGTTPYQYVLTLRMRYACERLQADRTSPTDLAAQLHYSSPGHFISAFKQVVGLTPSAYARLSVVCF